MKTSSLILLEQFKFDQHIPDFSPARTVVCLHLCLTLIQSGVILFTGEMMVTIPRESLGVNDRVWGIAAYNKEKVFLACRDDGLRKYTIKY